jgi:hypothetical protein
VLLVRCLLLLRLPIQCKGYSTYYCALLSCLKLVLSLFLFCSKGYDLVPILNLRSCSSRREHQINYIYRHIQKSGSITKRETRREIIFQHMTYTDTRQQKAKIKSNMAKKSRKSHTRDDSNQSETATASTNTAVEKKTSITAATANNNAVVSASSRDNSHDIEKSSQSASATSSSPADHQSNIRRRRRRRSLYTWCAQERQGIVWVWGCTLFGLLLGFGVGTGWLMGEYGKEPPMWRIALGGRIRSSKLCTRTIATVTSSQIWDGSDSTSSSGNALFPLGGKIKTFLGMHNIISFDDSSDTNASSLSRGMIPSVVVKKIDAEEMKNNPSHPFVYAVLREVSLF